MLLINKKDIYINPIICIIGHTLSGKTNLISRLIKDIDYNDLHIISVDSTAIYRDMNIGTSKPIKSHNCLYRLIDIIDPAQNFSVFDYYNKLIIEINNAFKLNKIPLLIGGSMFYFNYILNKNNIFFYNNIDIDFYIEYLIKINNNNIKKILYNRNININDNYRIKNIYKKIIFDNNFFIIKNKYLNKYYFHNYILINNNKILKKIKFRFYYMLSKSLEKEVINIYSRKDINKFSQSMQSIGYKQMIMYIENKIKYNDMIKLSIISTYRLYKKQINWINIFNKKYNTNLISSYDYIKNNIYKIIYGKKIYF